MTATCPHCGSPLRVEIVERVAVEHLAGEEPPPVMRFMSYCVNEFCWAHQQPLQPPPRP